MSDSPVAEVSTTVRNAESAVRHTASHLRFWFMAVTTLALDLGSKHWVFASLTPDESRTMIPHVLQFRRSLNDGAVFGSLTGHVELFIAASLLALGFVLYLFCGSSRRQPVLHLALGMVLAGTLGNLYDRAFMVADIVTYHTPSGREASVIGRIVSSAEDRTVRIGQWPEGTHVQSFDRSEVKIRQQGVVRDFIKFMPKFPAGFPKFGGYDIWPWIFNVADAGLVCGVGLLLLTSWRDRKPVEAPSPGAE